MVPRHRLTRGSLRMTPEERQMRARITAAVRTDWIPEIQMETRTTIMVTTMAMTTAAMTTTVKVTARITWMTPEKNNLRETLKERVCISVCTSFCCPQKNMGFLQEAAAGWDALE